ncbi:MAG: thioether cross-link-forming SCIFF peptide maturase [Oscillospiraceae bacterium]|nr:thioether cross-link-forming SCIFF peptide maturase [Oscillospiraceae bacterium]
MIHKYRLNGYNIVLDPNSGAVHLLDGLAFSLLDYIEDVPDSICPPRILSALSDKYSSDDIAEAYGELHSLYKSGQLWSSDDYGEIDGVFTEQSPIKAICLHVAHDCNLRCQYCFASKGDFGRGRELMDSETGMRAIDFLVANSGKRHNLEVDFFGGEPLMNWDVVKEIVAYARSIEKEHDKNFRFTLTTNGLLLSEDKIPYINQEMDNVVLSLDGRPEVNDAIRIRADGSGSYDSIIDKYKTFVRSRGTKDYYIRGTYTKYNLDFANDAKHMFGMGFDQISIEPAVTNDKLPFAITDEDLPRIFDEYEKLALHMIENRDSGNNFFHFMLDLGQGPCLIKRLRGCGSGNEYIAIVPGGDIYPCHQFVGMQEWRMGNIHTGEFDESIKTLFARTSVRSKQECKNCWAKYYCSGGCNANNFIFTGDVGNPHPLSCQLEKKRLECAIMIKAALK